MEKEVCLYKFNVELYNGVKSFYFENKKYAEVARRSVYKSFDKQRMTIKGFIPPVTKLEKEMIFASLLSFIS